MAIEAKEWVDSYSKYKVNSQIPDLTVGQMMEDVLWYIENYDWVTPVELERRYGEQGDGAHSLCLGKNMVVWTGMSEKLTTAIMQLLEAKAIHSHPGSYLAYIIDGGGLKLPLAKRPPKGGYAKEHWLPLVFRSGPKCTAKGCLGGQRSKGER